jgi:nucleoside-diphosphate-sugar epimerase
MSRIAILGCGYVGLELAGQLVGTGHDVVGVRRSQGGLDRVEEAGAHPVQADVTDGASLSAVPAVDAVVFAASSGGRDAAAAREVYVEGLQTSIDHFCAREHTPDRLVYTSSTGVYGDHDGAWVDEDTQLDPTTERTEVLVEAERTALERPTGGCAGTVARFGGLYGPDRYRLQRYVEGPVTAGYLNMVHRADAAGAVRHLLDSDRGRDAVVNVVADWLAGQCGRDPPPKRTVEQRLAEEALSRAAERRLLASKRVSNDRLRDCGYDLRYPTYREGYRPAIEADCE